ncbi:MAG: hypothetical protein LBU04_04585 [Christensenellaceae bacterium]|jgi:hypothetical protein|nr:hypothetical protein [Christensenellaceae bacterium]
MTVESIKPVNVLGLDFSMLELYVDSNGGSLIPAILSAIARETRKPRKLSLCQKSGKNRAKQWKKWRDCTHISNQRKDFLKSRVDG